MEQVIEAVAVGAVAAVAAPAILTAAGFAASGKSLFSFSSTLTKV